jgi:hypothetical protein
MMDKSVRRISIKYTDQMTCFDRVFSYHATVQENRGFTCALNWYS